MDIDGEAGEIDTEYTPIVDLLPADGGLELLAERVAVLENDASHWHLMARLRESERNIAAARAERWELLYREQCAINAGNEASWRQRYDATLNRIGCLARSRRLWKCLYRDAIATHGLPVDGQVERSRLKEG